MQVLNGTLHLGLSTVLGVACLLASARALAESPGVVLEGKDGPGKGKHIVFVIGDEEYRGEEGMPQLSKILARHHGFKCTLLFATNKETGEIDPMTLDNIPGLEALETADLMVMFLRFRELPDQQMKRIVDYTNSGKPIIALRGGARDLIEQFGIRDMMISISHCRSHATAYAMAMGEPREE